MSYKKTVLKNGITVLSEKVDYVRSISIGVWINAGSRDETSKNRGIAHFLEHMLFKGTAKRDKYEIAHFLESLGGAVNAFTSKEFTCFYVRVLSEYLKQSIDLLSDIIQNSVLMEKEIEKEKKVVLDEIHEVNDNPSDLIFEKFFEDLFLEHPLGHPIFGFTNDVEKFNKSTCQNFIANFYVPQRIIITTSGFLEHKKLIRYVKQYFHYSMKKGKKRMFPPITEIKQKENIYSYTTNHQTHICTGIRTFPYNGKNRIALLVLNAILSAGMSSRLFQNIREKYGIGYDIHSFAEFFHDTGFFGIYAATTPENSKKCLELIKSEIQAIVEKPVTRTELSTTKAQLKSSLVMGLESTTARMNRLAQQYIYTKSIKPIDEVMKEIESIEPDHIQELAQELFKPERFITTILKAKK
ncbi:MAG: insulinase family protein [Candidatus Cloacimonetes bacterium]|nr:insulinase family protein [Candidatus Cloacimonadota bacterium]MBL7085552.1 insulinase family protein [Candidatus Cloacimonadota bacterium]